MIPPVYELKERSQIKVIVSIPVEILEIGGGQDVTFTLKITDKLTQVFDQALMIVGDSMKEKGFKRDQLRLSHQDRECDEEAILRDVVDRRVILGCGVPKFILTVKAKEVEIEEQEEKKPVEEIQE